MGKSYWLKDEDQKGNFTNDQKDTFDEKKRYIGVRLQQGVPLLDRDWNELEDIRRYEELMLRKHYIGNGSPDDGFKISACNPPSNDFFIGTGRCMVDGFEVVNENSFHYNDQNLNALVPPTDNDRDDTIYLHVWIKEVKSLPDSKENDPEKVDASLGNSEDVKVETSVRHKLVWRVMVDEGSKGEYKISPSVKFVDHKYTDGKWDKYPVIDSLAGLRVLLKPTDASKLAQLVLDSKEEHTLKTGDKLDLGQGYTLTAKQVDVDGKKVWLEFDKDGQYVDDQVVAIDSGNLTWTCELDNILGENDVPVLKVHVKQILQDAVDIDGLWLIDYKNAVKIETGDEFEYHHYYDIARIKRKKETNEIQDSDIEDLREARGKNKITTQSLTIKNNYSKSKWPKLTSEAVNQVNLLGDLVIKDSGKVGIGTTDPTDKLDVRGNAYFGTGESGQNHKVVIRGPNGPGDSNSHQDLAYEFAGAGSAKIQAYRGNSWNTHLQFLTNSPTSGKDDPQVRMHIDGDGNVGIGTISPGRKLHVSSNDGKCLILENPTGGAGSTVSLDFQPSNENIPTPQYRLEDVQEGVVNLEDIQIEAKPEEVKPHEVQAAEAQIAETQAAGTQATEKLAEGVLSVPFPKIPTFSLQAINNGKNSSHMAFLTNDPGTSQNNLVERLRITSDGKVGIGTTNPISPLTIRSNGDYHELISFEDPSGVSKWHIYHKRDEKYGLIFDESGQGQRLFLQEGGNVGIGTLDPKDKLAVNGDIYLTGKIIQEEWTAPPELLSGWENYRVPEGFSQAGYFRDKNGVVHLRGVVGMKTIQEISRRMPIFNLPQGYTPEFVELHAVISGSSSGFGRCDISPDGQVTAVAGSTLYFSLCGITFRARTLPYNIVEKQVVTDGDNGKSITLKNGESFYLRLNSPSIGISWKFRLISPGLSILSSEIQPHKVHPEGEFDPEIDLGGIYVWEIKAITQGNQQIEGVLWDNNQNNSILDYPGFKLFINVI